jgi:hypothetical protein
MMIANVAVMASKRHVIKLRKEYHPFRVLELCDLYSSIIISRSGFNPKGHQKRYQSCFMVPLGIPIAIGIDSTKPPLFLRFIGTHGVH